MAGTTGPARVVPPGRIIARELEARGWQQKDLASILGRPEQAISEIINGRKQITPETARELASAFGTSVDLWMNLEANYRLQLARREKEEDAVRRRARLYAVVPYGELVERNWVEGHSDLDEQERELCRFLGVSSLAEEHSATMFARHSAHGEPERRAQIAWAKRVEHLARQQTVGVYDASRLEALVEELLVHSVEPAGVRNVPERLLAAGVHFVIVPHLRQTYLDGGALWLNEHPVVALTLRYNRLDNFWFTLAHELAHIALGHLGTYLDRLDDEHGLTQEEREADALARDWLIEAEAYDRFRQAGTYARAAIRLFAREQRRHPSIIAGRLQHDGALPFNRHPSYRIRVREHLAPWIDSADGSRGER